MNGIIPVINGKQLLFDRMNRKRWIAMGLFLVVLLVGVQLAQRGQLHIPEVIINDQNVTTVKKQHQGNTGALSTQLPISSLSVKTSDRRSVQYVPFPHQYIGVGSEDAACTWLTWPKAEEQQQLLVVSLAEADVIQRAAIEEGMCLPTNPKYRTMLRVFSSAEAVDCMRQANTSFFVAGDSYTLNLFIGLADILLADPSNYGLWSGRTRQGTRAQRNNQLIEMHRNHGASFPDIQMACHPRCYGSSWKKGTFATLCAGCLNPLIADKMDAVAVVGAGAHTFASFGNNAAAAPLVAQELKRFLDMTNNRVISVSMPSYHEDKLPDQYRNQSHHTHSEVVYNETRKFVAPNDMNAPYLDVFQVTKSCLATNCTRDGGHFSRYVNRWKAQLFLNTICRVVD